MPMYDYASPSRSRSRSSSPNYLPTPHPPRSSSSSSSSSSRRRRRHSTSAAPSSQKQSQADYERKNLIKTSAFFLGSIAVAAVCAEKFWPKGITYGEKEAWEREKAAENDSKKKTKDNKNTKGNIDDGYKGGRDTTTTTRPRSECRDPRQRRSVIGARDDDRGYDYYARDGNGEAGSSRSSSSRRALRDDGREDYYYDRKGNRGEYYYDRPPPPQPRPRPRSAVFPPPDRLSYDDGVVETRPRPWAGHQRPREGWTNVRTGERQIRDSEVSSSYAGDNSTRDSGYYTAASRRELPASDDYDIRGRASRPWAEDAGTQRRSAYLDKGLAPEILYVRPSSASGHMYSERGRSGYHDDQEDFRR